MSNAGAFGTFWKAAASSCLPDLPSPVAAIFESAWRDFARRLPRKGSLLDLGTGGGAVLAMVGRERGDLKLVGVDSAVDLPAAPRGAKLRGSVRIESLPFNEASFDGLCSQFGFEYADQAGAVREAARVLRPGGFAQFIVHNRDGVIVAHNEARLAAIRWATKESGLFDKARAVADVRRRSALLTPPFFAAAVSDARARFPRQPVAAEIALAVLRTLEGGKAARASATSEALAAIEAKARGETERLEALCRVALDEAGIAALGQELAAAGIGVAPPIPLALADGGPVLAWLISGNRE